MFQFGRFPSRSHGMTRHYPRRVSPFGYLRLSRSYTPHRSFSQYNTSFLGTRYLGIRCAPLLAFRSFVRNIRLAWHALLGITFALIILLVRRTEPRGRGSQIMPRLYWIPICLSRLEIIFMPNSIKIGRDNASASLRAGLRRGGQSLGFRQDRDDWPALAYLHQQLGYAGPCADRKRQNTSGRRPPGLAPKMAQRYLA